MILSSDDLNGIFGKKERQKPNKFPRESARLLHFAERLCYTWQNNSKEGFFYVKTV